MTGSISVFLHDNDDITGLDIASRAGPPLANAACRMGSDIDFHFHRLNDGDRIADRNRHARLDQQFPNIARHSAGNAEAASGNIAIKALRDAFVADEAVEPLILPAVALG